MKYATNYDVGDRKRPSGINEDSIAITVFEQGHREGFLGYSERDGNNTDPGGDSDTPVNRSAAAFALADGAGGHNAGDVASYIAATRVSERLAPVAIGAAGRDPSEFGIDLESDGGSPDAGTIEGQIGNAIVEAHREVVRYAASTGTGAYTTVVAGICVGGRLHYGWVGDSRAYVINAQRKEIDQLTKDHALVEELRDAEKIDDVEAHVHPRSNEITRALGGTGVEDPEKATVDVETDTVELFAEDIVFVTSDGVIDAQTDARSLHDEYIRSDRSEEAAAEILDSVVTDEDIREWILSADSLEAASEVLIERSNERGGKDNMSALLLRDPALPDTPREGPLPVRAQELEELVNERETILVSDE